MLVFIVGAVFGGNFAIIAIGYNSAGGWLAFVAFYIMVFDVIVIIGRFINFAFVYQFPLWIMLVVSGDVPIGGGYPCRRGMSL